MANKKITDATTATSVAGTDKVFLNQGGDLKQVDLNSAVANSQAVQTLNSNLDLNIIPATSVEIDNNASYIKRKGNFYIIKLHLKIKETKDSYQDIVDISIIPNKISFAIGYDISTSSALCFQLNSSGHFVCTSKLNNNSNIIIDTIL